MKILLVAATAAEINPFLTHHHLPEGNFIKTQHFDVLITGVGMIATAFALGQKLTNKYKLVLNVGIAGSFDQNIELGELVNVATDVFAELGAENNEEFITIDDLGFGKSAFKAKNELVIDLPSVKGITVNRIHGNADTIRKIIHTFKPQVESMEGAAVFFACHEMGLQSLQIRSISNFVEPRNKENWKIGLAIQTLNNWLINFIATKVSVDC